MTLRTKSDSSPSAPITKLLHRPAEVARSISGKVSKLDLHREELGNYYFLFCLMESSGCRISELLHATHDQITSSGKILIHGSKRSHDRFISDSRASQYLIKKKLAKCDPFMNMNRFTARRHLQRISYFTYKKGRINLTMTGVFREQFAKEIREVENTDKAVSKFIGHKSFNNGQHYGKG